MRIVKANYLLIIAMVLASFVAQAQDSLKIRWAVEISVSPDAVSLRGRVTIADKHRILFGPAYDFDEYPNYYPARLGYQFAPRLEGKKHRWIYVFDIFLGWRRWLSPSRLIVNDDHYVLTDQVASFTSVYPYIGFGIEFNFLKYFKMSAYPLIGSRFHWSRYEYSNPELEPLTYKSRDWLAAGLGLGLIYEFPSK